MSEEDKIYAFVAFGIESYKQAKGLSGAEAAQKFACYGANRKRPSFSHGYDYVRGPVANDQVYAAFAFYESGLFTFEMLLEQLKVRKLFDQILFHTDRALGLLQFVRSFGGGSMGEVNQSNVHLLLPWKVSALAALWAADLGVSRMEAQRRFYGTKFYRDLEDESTKLWTLSPEQLYLIFHTAA